MFRHQMGKLRGVTDEEELGGEGMRGKLAILS
jgi:hypothetical protein